MNSETSVGIKDEGEDDIALTAARLCRLDDDDFSRPYLCCCFPKPCGLGRVRCEREDMMIVIILTQTMERSSSLCSSSLEVSRDDIIIIRARAREQSFIRYEFNVKSKIWIFNSAVKKIYYYSFTVGFGSMTRNWPPEHGHWPIALATSHPASLKPCFFNVPTCAKFRSQ